MSLTPMDFPRSYYEQPRVRPYEGMSTEVFVIRGVGWVRVKL